jgi:hypothetical protein
VVAAAEHWFLGCHYGGLASQKSTVATQGCSIVHVPSEQVSFISLLKWQLKKCNKIRSLPLAKTDVTANCTGADWIWIN